MPLSPKLPYPCPCMHCGQQCTEADRRNHRYECRSCVLFFARAMLRWTLGGYDPEIDLLMLDDWKRIN